MKNKFLAAVVALISIPLIIWAWDRYKDEKIIVRVDSASPLYSSENDAAYGSKNPVKVLKPAERLRVKRTTYGKDYWALFVETSDGSRGWIVSGQSGIFIHK